MAAQANPVLGFDRLPSIDAKFNEPPRAKSAPNHRVIASGTVAPFASLALEIALRIEQEAPPHQGLRKRVRKIQMTRIAVGVADVPRFRKIPKSGVRGRGWELAYAARVICVRCGGASEQQRKN